MRHPRPKHTVNVRVPQRLILADLLHKRINHPDRGADIRGRGIGKAENTEEHRQSLRYQDGCKAYSAHQNRVFRTLAEEHLEGYINHGISEAQAQAEARIGSGIKLHALVDPCVIYLAVHRVA